MKNFKSILLAIGVILFMTISIYVEHSKTELLSNDLVYVESQISQTNDCYIYEASIFDSLKNFFKNRDWSNIINALFAGALVTIIASVRKAKKEIKDVIDKYKEAIKDGVITQDEANKIIKELAEAIESITKVWYLITGIFKKKKIE